MARKLGRFITAREFKRSGPVPPEVGLEGTALVPWLRSLVGQQIAAVRYGIDEYCERPWYEAGDAYDATSWLDLDTRAGAIYHLSVGPRGLDGSNASLLEAEEAKWSRIQGLDVSDVSRWSSLILGQSVVNIEVYWKEGRYGADVHPTWAPCDLEVAFDGGARVFVSLDWRAAEVRVFFSDETARQHDIGPYNAQLTLSPPSV